MLLIFCTINSFFTILDSAEFVLSRLRETLDLRVRWIQAQASDFVKGDCDNLPHMDECTCFTLYDEEQSTCIMLQKSKHLVL